MNYAYIRVSTDRQTVENQRFEIENFSQLKKIMIDKWIEEKISSIERLEDRKFGKLLKKMKKGDQLVVTELSRMGRNLMQIMKILHDCMENEIMVYTIKENYELGNNINSKVLAFAFGLSAEIERNLISQRTKEALARRKAEGVILGRPLGRKSSKTKLTGKEKKIQELLKSKVSYSAIGRLLKVHRLTVAAFIKNNNIY
jgi:DNA invertase Pin-like site-specific DNA recombinase